LTNKDINGPKATSPVLEIRGLHKSFKGHLGIGKTAAVSGLDLSVMPGEIFGLLGPNGAGKTTTLKMLMGLLRPDDGEIALFGGSPSDPKVRARIGFLPENPYFYEYLNAVEFLDLYGRLQGIPRRQRREKVDEVLDRVGLRGRENRALRKFSKGMIQRLGLAQAIQHDPDLVILDEPMSGLDPVGRREVRDLIISLRDANKTVFFSSHILQDVEMICDRVAIIKQGRLVSAGRLDELISSSVKWIEVSYRGQVGDGAPLEIISDDGDVCLVRVPDVDALSVLLDRLRQSGAQVLSVWPRRDSLEDLFMREISVPCDDVRVKT
jgi:ABC-2 type transport system ATP-binding protein